MSVLCKIKGHKWYNECGGQNILTWNGYSRCFRCGHEENRGADPASWFGDGESESYGEIHPERIPSDARV